MRSPWQGVIAVLTGCLLAAACDERPAAPPIQRQDDARLAEIASQGLARTGRIRVAAFAPGEPSTQRVRFDLRRPLSRVEDTDIRGMLDGKMKYPFNQATAYHMRVGRRIDGPFEGELELKRSLVRWHLPALPRGARVTAAELTVWVEMFPTNSPLTVEAGRLPVHLYAYPLDEPWEPGGGGTGKDSFSEAAPGEASWVDGRTGQQPWQRPGALAPGTPPLAMGTIETGDRPLTLVGPRLARRLQTQLDRGGTFDVLFKQEAENEALWGTELGLLSSEFGGDADLVVKRPRLRFEIALPEPLAAREEEFLLEPGGAVVFARLEHRRPAGGELLISAELDVDRPDGPAPPRVWIRGGESGRAEAEWEPHVNPVSKPWDWSQLKLEAAPRRLQLGRELAVELLVTWVAPGPRESQLPELLLRAPSGRIHRVNGVPGEELRYAMRFVPDEPGLWRYGWSFRPMPESPPGFHRGRSMVFVDRPTGEAERIELEAFAARLVESISGRTETKASDQHRINAFVRWAADYARQGSGEEQTSKRLLQAVRQVLPKKFRPDWDKPAPIP